MAWQLKKLVGHLNRLGKKYNFLARVSYVLLILSVAHPVYFKNYFLPSVVYWDEVYHISSAAKYIQKVHFMEPHPPLGKMFIAWGEQFLTWGESQYGWRANGGKTFGFEGADSTPSDMPEGFTFAGYRLFPTMAGWLNALLFTLILVQLLGSRAWALLFLPLYLFDNALITQSRGAMLDSLMLFGFFLGLWGFLKVLNTQKLSVFAQAWGLFIMVLGFAFAIMIKNLALILILLWPLLFWIKRKDKKALSFYFKASLLQTVFFFLFCGLVWGYHIRNSQRIVPSLPGQGLYVASSQYEKILTGLPHSHGPVESYWFALKDNFKYFFRYQKGVEVYDQNKGHYSASFPISWPFASRPVFFRRTYPDEFPSRFLILLPNFVVWLMGLLGVLLTSGALVAGFLLNKQVFSRKNSIIMTSLLLLYFSYMIAVSSITRALFLYHYMIPLTISFFLFSLFCFEVIQYSVSKMKQRLFRVFVGLLPLACFAVFLFNKPLTYFEALTCDEAYSRLAVPYWGVNISLCPNPKTDEIPSLRTQEFRYNSTLHAE